MTPRVGDDDRIGAAELEQLGVDPSAPESEDTLKLVRYLRDRGARREEMVEAVAAGTLGPLALSLRFARRASQCLSPRPPSRRVLRPTRPRRFGGAGFPDPTQFGAGADPAQVATLQVLSEMGRSLLGTDTTLQLARVMSGSLALLAEAIVDAFRVKVEMPKRLAGEPYSAVVTDYASMASLAFPAFAEAVGDVLRTHVLERVAGDLVA